MLLSSSTRRYIKDAERKELLQQAISFCTQSFRRLLKEHSVDHRDNRELEQLLVEIYKAQKKCLKHMVQKESLFSTLLVDAYKVYLDDKVARLPDNFNYFDYAMKFCNYEIVSRKNLAKNGGTLPPPFTLPESLFVTFKPAPLTSLLASMQPARIASPKTVSTPPPPPPAASPLPPPPPPPPPSQTHPSITITTVPTAQLLQQPRAAAAITSIQSIVTPTTTQTTSMARNSNSSIVATSTSAYAVSANTSAQSTIPRPRGRPPGSKNANVGGSGISFPSSFLPPNSSGSSPRLDPATMAAIMSMCNLSPSPPTAAAAAASAYSDPNSVSAFLNEFYKFSGLAGLSSPSSAPNFMLPPTSLPQFDMNNFISSAAAASAPKLPAAPSTSSTASTIISVGSGQLTITPSTSTTAKLHKDLQTKNYGSSSNIFADMPGISVTKVKPKPSAAVVGIPKDLPKSLTITPTTAGYNAGGKPTPPSQAPLAANQFPYVPMQGEKRAAVAQKPRKKTQQKTIPNLTASFGSFAGPSTSSSTPSYSLPNAAAFNAATMHDYTQQMAMLSQYTDLMKTIDPSHAAALLAYSKMTTGAAAASSSAGSTKGKVRGRKPSSLVVPTATAAETAFNKGRLSVKQLQTMQQTSQRRVSSPQMFPTPSSSASKPLKSSPLPQFQMPEIPGRNMSPYGMMGGMSVTTSPILAHSPNKSPVLPPPPPQLPSPGSSGSGGSGSSPKTLQQKLAERKKVNDVVNHQQMAAIAAAAVAARNNSSEYTLFFLCF